MKHVATALAVLFFGVTATTIGGCGDDDDDGGGNNNGSPDNTGQTCKLADECYKDVTEELKGTRVCLDANDGYCTHTCTSNADCCAVDGECKTGLVQLCAPFESEGMHCFLSCEEADIGGRDPQEYCQTEITTDFICRASGGGDPKKICYPADCGVGESCAGDADCAAGLTCLTELKGGYCGKKDCNTNADCPANSNCTNYANGKYCLLKCGNDFDCSMCRDPDLAGTCSSDVTYVDTTSTGSVCVPPA